MGFPQKSCYSESVKEMGYTSHFLLWAAHLFLFSLLTIQTSPLSFSPQHLVQAWHFLFSDNAQM